MTAEDDLSNIPNAQLEDLGGRIATYSMGLLSTLGLHYRPAGNGEGQCEKLSPADLAQVLTMWALLKETIHDLEKVCGEGLGARALRELQLDAHRPHHRDTPPPLGWAPPNVVGAVELARQVERLAADARDGAPLYAFKHARGDSSVGVLHWAIKEWARVVMRSPPDCIELDIVEHVLYRLGFLSQADARTVTQGVGTFSAEKVRALIERGVQAAAPSQQRELMPAGGAGAEALPPRYAALVNALRRHFLGGPTEEEYVILGGAPLAVRGLRDIENLDVLVHPRAWVRLGLPPEQPQTTFQLDGTHFSTGARVLGTARLSPVLSTFYPESLLGQIGEGTIYMSAEPWYGVPILNAGLARVLYKRTRATAEAALLEDYVPKDPFTRAPSSSEAP